MEATHALSASAQVQGNVPVPASSREEWRTFWRFFRYCVPYKDKIILSVLVIFIGVPMGQIGVFMGRYLVDEVILNTQAATDWRIRTFFIIIGLQILMWGISQTMTLIRQVMGYYVDLKVTLFIRKLFYNHLHSLSLNFFRTRPVGEHMYRSVADMGGLVHMITHDVPDMADIVYRIIWGAVLLSLVDWRITLLVLVYVLPYTFLSHYFYSRLQETLRAARVQEQAAAAALRDGIAGAKTVKGFGRIAHQVRKYCEQLIHVRRVHLRWFFLNILTHHFALWSLLWIVGKVKWLYIVFQTMSGNLTIGEFSVTFWLIGQFEGPMLQIVQHFQNIRLRIVYGQRVLETLDVPIDIKDAPDAHPLPRVQGRIEFQNITFEYLPGRPVLKNVSFALEPGTTAAFVGPSGGGKSTIMYLLMRLYDPMQGRVLVDGRDLREIQLSTWHQQVGVVLQDTYLFGGSIRDNICYGKLSASEEEIAHAARLADLHEFILRLPRGYDTDLGEGTKISGGEKQRIGIARALVRDPQVFIFDEPTANLDSRHEENIVRTMERVRAGRTTFIVSHRLVTVTDADVIFVLKDGEIVEQGTHLQLLAHGGLYARMWEEQMRLGGVTREEME